MVELRWLNRIKSRSERSSVDSPIDRFSQIFKTLVPSISKILIRSKNKPKCSDMRQLFYRLSLGNIARRKRNERNCYRHGRRNEYDLISENYNDLISIEEKIINLQTPLKRRKFR